MPSLHTAPPVAAALLAFVVCLAPPVGAARAAGIDPSSYADMHWRSIGPFRGGRAVAVSGVVGDPRTFYFGAVGGGVWKTGNAGRTWTPIMDSQPVSSIGAIAVAPGDPKTVYVGSGEADMRSDITHGNGIYRSSDSGATWTHAGLDDSRQIARILVDPHDSRRLLVAALGHAYGPNETRGVYRSIDGGTTWARTLFVDPNTGAADLASDPSLRVVFASLWQTRRPPWSVYPPSSGPRSGLYRSTDGGETWSAAGNGIPPGGLGRTGVAVAPSNPKRAYAIVDATAGGLYRSDDLGATWRLIDGDPRLWQRGWYFCHVTIDPKNADVVYVSNTSLYRSTDGGAHFTAIKGSPDGDDFHQLWIDPTDASRMVLGSDQGATVSIDGGGTWSSWFNQPTGQFYHVSTDTEFPFHLYGAQQDSGAAMIVSRSNHRGIQERDWRPISAGGETGSIAPDSRDPFLIYGGVVDREDLRSNQTRIVSPLSARPGWWRSEWTMPLAFGIDHALYAAQQVVFRSRDGGSHWVAVSDDLARRNAGIPDTLDPTTAAHADGPEPRGVVYALAPSPLRADVLWAGTDDGLVYVTADGARKWMNVTPPGVTAWSHVDAIEASHFDSRSAYVPIDRHRLDDDRPFIYATHDAGRTWRAATAGIPNGSFVHVVREDPARRGLLYAGTETGVFVSFDDGVAWQSLRMNMPTVPVYDISVRAGDLAIATHGRSFWVLDDLTPLRQLARDAAPGARLFAPREAIRTRPGTDEAEASPPETPLGENPPNGAFIDYVVPSGSAGPVTLAIVDRHGATIRRWSSADKPQSEDPSAVDFPPYWLSPPVRVAAEPGMHRFVWDFHASNADGPLAPPGAYTVQMTLAGRTYVQRLVMRRDPRVRATDADLVAQFALATEIDALRTRVSSAIEAADEVRTKPHADVRRIDAIAGLRPVHDPRNFASSIARTPGTLRYESRLLSGLEESVESADSAPTADERAAWPPLRAEILRTLAAWDDFTRSR